MTEPAHYNHGPSGASRWLICTDSPFAQEGYPDETSDAADEGTAAHWLLEQCLTAGQDCATYVDAAIHEGHGWITNHGGQATILAGEETGCLKEWPITGEMIEAVQLHIDTVKPDANKKGTRLFVEERVRLDQYLGLPEPVGGTADTILYLPRSKTLKVIDFKYGRGHVVEVESGEWGVNPQLGIYALAAMAELERLLGEKREVNWIELIVVQPRAHHKKGPVRRSKLSPFQFMELEAAIFAAFRGRKRVAGDHCHFCRAKPDCEAFHADRHAKATADFGGEAPAGEDKPEWVGVDHADSADATAYALAKAPEVPALMDLQQVLAAPVKGLSRDTLGRVRQALPALREWMKEVEEEVKSRLLHDIPVPGARLAPGRGKRSFGGAPDDVAAATLATAEALDVEYQDLHTQPALKSPAQLEKEFGKAKFKETALAKFVAYTAGGPMVVDEDSDAPDWVKDEFEAEEEVKSSLL